MSLDPTGTVGFCTTFTVQQDLHIGGFLDDSANAGNRTQNRIRGRNAFAGAASTCVITNSFVTANSIILVQLEAPDNALTSIIRVAPAAGSFTVTANAASTGTAAVFSWLVIPI